jgi:hypothetical protein
MAAVRARIPMGNEIGRALDAFNMSSGRRPAPATTPRIKAAFATENSVIETCSS